MKATAVIPFKFPSLNEYVSACRGNRYNGARVKKAIQANIGWCLTSLPEFVQPVFIEFTWIEGNNRRDWDNVVYAKKFILDAMVNQGKLTNDGRKVVKGFTDHFGYEKNVWRVIVEIEEVPE